MSWRQESKNWKERRSEYERNSMETEERIRDLRRRIEELRNRLHTPRPSPIRDDEEVVEPPRDVEEARKKQERANELNDIKAKLLGRKV